MKPVIRAKRKHTTLDEANTTPETPEDNEPKIQVYEDYREIIPRQDMVKHIKVRVLNVSNKLIEFSNSKSNGVRFTGEVVFADSTTMRFAAFNDQAKDCYSKLKRGKLYLIKAKLQNPLPLYNDDQLEILFGPNCDIVPSDEDMRFPTHVFKPVPSIKTILDLTPSDRDTKVSRFTNVLGVVIEIYDETRTPEGTKTRCLDIADASNCSVKVNFYGEQVTQIMSIKAGSVIYFRALKIVPYGGAKPTRVLEFSSLSYFVEAAKAPFSSYAQTETTTAWARTAHDQNIESISYNSSRDVLDASNVVSIMSVRNECSKRNYASTSRVVVHCNIAKLITDPSQLIYKACNRPLAARATLKCSKKVHLSGIDSSYYICTDNHTERTASDIAKIQLIIKDVNSSKQDDERSDMQNILEVTAFGKSAEGILAISIEDLLAAEADELPELHMQIGDYLMSTTYRMALKCETVIDSKPRYTVVDVVAVNKEGDIINYDN